MYRNILLIVLLVTGVDATASMMGRGMMGPRSAPATPPAKNADPAIRQGYNLTRQFCTGCHQAPNPSQHTAAEWPQVLSRMQAYMQQQRRNAPDANEKQSILNYLGNSNSDHNQAGGY